jgi:outer membrane protein assembly complex protein YaeT
MLKRWVIAAMVVVSLVGAALRAQDKRLRENLLPAAATLAAKFEASRGAIVNEITFTGLRRISPKTLTSQIASRPGEPLDAAKIEKDVRTLAHTEWFETVRAEVQPSTDAAANARDASERLKLIFYVPEMPFLTKVEYGGSGLLSQAQIKKLLKEKKLEPKLGSPENPVALDATCRAIESALAELAHPHGQVKIIREESSQATVQVKFEITDGPHIPVGRVLFEGSPAVSDRKLKGQMRRLSPDSFFASVRGKNAYSRDAFEEDRERLLAYYQNHGYPEARVGTAQTHEYESDSWGWFPWPHKSQNNYLGVTIPIEAGTFYRTTSVATSAPLEEAAGLNGARRFAPPKITPTPVYSAQDTENLRRAWEARVRAWAKRENAGEIHDVEVIRTMDAATHSVRITLDLSSTPRYTVRRLEFRGIHHFPDRYFRKRIGVKEGQSLDDRALEAGLRRLGRTGYFKPIKKEDIQVTSNDLAHTIDVTIHIEELGLQRVSLLGGTSQFGNTLGIAYSLFNILDREELLTSKIEGGPESLQIALSLAKEGFLGSRGSLALSVFNTFLRPRLTGSVTGPFYNQSTKGVTADWSYTLSSTNTFSTNYTLSHSVTSYSPTLTTGLIGSTGLPTADVTAASSSHAVGAGWTHDSGNERIAVADSVSGGLLGGSENVLRSKFEFGRILPDPFFGHGNAWAFRTTFAGAGSYSGDMPLTSRLFAGDQYVRGLRDGELGPSAVVSSLSSSGATVYSAAPAGANLIGAMNLEYRVRLSSGAEAAGFFDLGSGLLLPNWLGPSRPWLVDSTNGIIHGSTGIEVRWTLPGIGVPLRVYYALNILRLNRPVWLPGGTLTQVQNRFASFGWGLGSLF